MADYPESMRIDLAASYHQEANKKDADAASYRRLRDEQIIALRRDGWTYRKIAEAVGCSPELIAYICRVAS